MIKYFWIAVYVLLVLYSSHQIWSSICHLRLAPGNSWLEWVNLVRGVTGVISGIYGLIQLLGE